MGWASHFDLACICCGVERYARSGGEFRIRDLAHQPTPRTPAALRVLRQSAESAARTTLVVIAARTRTPTAVAKLIPSSASAGRAKPSGASSTQATPSL